MYCNTYTVPLNLHRAANKHPMAAAAGLLHVLVLLLSLVCAYPPPSPTSSSQCPLLEEHGAIGGVADTSGVAAEHCSNAVLVLWRGPRRLAPRHLLPWGQGTQQQQAPLSIMQRTQVRGKSRAKASRVGGGKAGGVGGPHSRGDINVEGGGEKVDVDRVPVLHQRNGPATRCLGHHMANHDAMAGACHIALREGV